MLRGFDGDPISLVSALLGGAAVASRPLPMDVREVAEGIELVFDVPGASVDDVELSVLRDALTITVEHPEAQHGGRLLVSERTPARRSQRTIRLSRDTYDLERASALIDAGVLHVSVPAREQAQPRRIAVATVAERAEEIAAAS